MSEQKHPNGTRVLIIRPGHPWENETGTIVDFYPDNPFHICYAVEIRSGVRAGCKEGDSRERLKRIRFLLSAGAEQDLSAGVVRETANGLVVRRPLTTHEVREIYRLSAPGKGRKRRKGRSPGELLLNRRTTP